jgi:urocanate hydratase
MYSGIRTKASKLKQMPTPQSNSAEAAYRLYAALAQTISLDPITGLGGKLLYAGEINPETRNLLYAANIAGAASLAVSSDPAALRLAMRDGVVDFFVNSLEEALRILKNEIRKHQTVAVGVATEPHLLATQMLERGVLPDLLPSDSENAESGLSRIQVETFLNQGARQIVEPAGASRGLQDQFVSWIAERDFALWLPRLDGYAHSVLPPEDSLRQRWMRLAPRYMGRLAQRQHGVVLTEEEFVKFEALVNESLGQTGAEAAERPKVFIEKSDL